MKQRLADVHFGSKVERTHEECEDDDREPADADEPALSGRFEPCVKGCCA